MKKFLHKLFVLSIMAIVMVMWTMPLRGQTVHLYLDSVADWSTHYFCMNTVDTVVLHKLSGTVVTQWNCSVPPYVYYDDTLSIPNTYNSLSPTGLLTYYYVGGGMSVYIIFDTILVSPNLMDQTLCGSTPITLDAGNPGVTRYLWSTGDTTQTIQVNATDTYWVTVLSACGNVMDSCSLIFVAPQAELCVVTFDTATQKNKLIWDGTNLQGQWMAIQKRDISNTMTTIDVTPFSDGYYVDMSSNPQSEQAEYAVQIIDTCTNTSDTSIHHFTIWLQISDFGQDVYFQYSTYGGIYVPTYTLYGIRPAGQVDSLKSVAAAFNYFYLPDTIADNYVKFYVGFPVSCGGAKSTIQTKSNIVDGLTGITEHSIWSFFIYPNPTDGILNIMGDLEIREIQMFDVSGRMLFSTAKESVIDMSGFPTGIYIIKIIAADGVYRSKVVKR